VVSSLKKLDRSEDKDWKLSDKTDTEKIQALLKKAEKENLSVRELRNIVQEHKANQNREIALANEPDKYRVFYADPPWEYRNSGFEMSAANHYPVMATDKICDMRIPAAENTISSQAFTYTVKRVIRRYKKTSYSRFT